MPVSNALHKRTNLHLPALGPPSLQCMLAVSELLELLRQIDKAVEDHRI
jgi:hypothetical protein